MENKYTIHTDGGSRGNPGLAAIGVVIEGVGMEKKEYGERIGVATNNDAEYKAVIFALKKMKLLIGSSASKKACITVLMDSELIVKQLNYQYKVREENMQKLFIEVHNLRLDFGKIEFKHVLRGKNEDADRMVNRALDGESYGLDL